MAYFKNIKPREKIIIEDDNLGSMYLEDTEVLTKDGFKKMLNLEEGDSILTRYCDSNITEWEEDEHKYPDAEKMLKKILNSIKNNQKKKILATNPMKRNYKLLKVFANNYV